MNSYNVYYRDEDGKLGHILVGDCDSHDAAIAAVKESLPLMTNGTAFLATAAE